MSGGSLIEFIHGMPKVELHLHIEGTLEPESMLEFARRNGVTSRFDSADAARAAYDFSDLGAFLELYYAGAEVLRTERDFYDLARAYLERAHSDRVRHAEVFFDPQTHTARGVPFGDVVSGIARALAEAEAEWGLTSALIMCFLRDAGVASAEATLDQALEYRDLLTGVGLDSAEEGYPPGLFAGLFERARAAGLRRVAHAGEEGPADYVREALDTLGAERIDHGVRSLEDPDLVDRLARERVPLTVCPLSNVRLGVVPSMERHPLGVMLERGMVATVNSDDPAYFGGYLGDNFVAVQKGLGFDREQLLQLARNAIEASFIDQARRDQLSEELEVYAAHSEARGAAGDEEPGRVLVLGATGYIGGLLVPELLARGHAVRCLVRDRAKLARVSWSGDVDVVEGDALDVESLPAAFEDVHTIYYLIHSMGGASGSDFARRDKHAASNVALVAREQGVRRIIYLGGLGADTADLSEHLASRREVERVLAETGVPVTVFRAAVIVGAGSVSFRMVRYLAERLPVLVTPRWVSTRTQPVAQDDVLRYLADALVTPDSVGRTFEIGGVDVLTYGDMIRIYSRMRGLRRALIPVPVLTPKLSSYWVGLVTPISSSIAIPLIQGLKSEVVVRDPAAREVFPFEPLSYEVAVRRVLEEAPRP